MYQELHAWQPLPRAEVINAVEWQRPARVPLIRARWWGEGLVQQYGDRLRELERYPEDAAFIMIEPVQYARRFGTRL